MSFILNKMCIFSVFQSFCFYTVSQRFWTLEFLLTGNMTEMLNQPLDKTKYVNWRVRLIFIQCGFWEGIVWLIFSANGCCWSTVVFLKTNWICSAHIFKRRWQLLLLLMVYERWVTCLERTTLSLTISTPIWRPFPQTSPIISYLSLSSAICVIR